MSTRGSTEERKTKMSKDAGLVRESSKGKILSPDEHIGVQIFNFRNGDMYVGHFRATIKEEIFRHGYGKYFCNDGSIYSGIWQDDYLVEAKNITFNDGDTYEGPLKNFQFSGTGYYGMAKVGRLKITFIDNNPTGEVLLTDPYGFNWHGFSADDCNETTLFPINHFKNKTLFSEKLVDEDIDLQNQEREITNIIQQEGNIIINEKELNL